MIRPLALICAVLATTACMQERATDEPEVSAAFTFAAANFDPNAIAKQLFGAAQNPSEQPAAALGSYSRGCMAGGAQLAETGPHWQAMRLSRNRNWAHPVTISFLQRLAKFAATQPGWEGLYIGDLSQPRGGPMLTGHVSHQIGLDADIWMLPPKTLKLSRLQRENISSISMQRNKGAYVNDEWTKGHMEILKAAASDPAVARIFVFAGAKVQMCKDATGDRRWLRKIRPWYGHHYHFHIRLLCPDGSKGCVNQTPPPPGDGCDQAQEWVDNILNPPPPQPPDADAPPPQRRGEYVLADLPAQCASVLSSQ